MTTHPTILDDIILHCSICKTHIHINIHRKNSGFRAHKTLHPKRDLRLITYYHKDTHGKSKPTLAYIWDARTPKPTSEPTEFGTFKAYTL